MADNNNSDSNSTPSFETSRRTRLLAGVAIVVVAGSLLSGWMLASERARQEAAPTRVVAVGAHVMVAVSERLFRFQHDIGDSEEIPFPSYDADQALASFGKQGVIFREGDVAHSFKESIRRFLREPAPARLAPPDVLFHCSLSGDCRPLPVHLPPIEGASHLLWIDTLSRLVVVDTSAHRLLWFSGQGELLAERKQLRYPNQPLYHGDALYVVDTNNHRIVRFGVAGGDLADHLESIPVRAEGRHRWPVALARFAESWWVLLADSGLAHARLQQYDDDWNWQRTVRLPEEADPVAMAVHEQRLLVADLNGRRLWQLYPDARLEALPDAGPLGTTLAEARRAHQAWDRVSTVILGSFIGLLPVGFWIAWRLDGTRHRRLMNERYRMLYPAGEQDALPQQTIWLEHTRAVRLRWVPLVVLLLTVGLCAALAIDEAMRKLWPVWTTMLAVMAVALGTVFIFLDAAAKSRIGVGPEGLTLVDHRNRRRTGQGAEIRYSRVLVVIGDVIVWVGNPQQPLYCRDQIREYLAPALKNAEPLGDLEQWGFIMRSDHGPLRMALVVVCLALVGCLVFVIQDLIPGL